MSCFHCGHLSVKILIDKPEDLIKIIKIIKLELSQKVLSVVEDNNNIWKGKAKDFDAITENKWIDLILFDFNCNFCGQLFSLSVETYHGSGGSWKPQV